MKTFQYLLNIQRLFVTFLQSLRLSVQFMCLIMYCKHMSVSNKFISADIHNNLRIYQKVWRKAKSCLWMFLAWIPQGKISSVKEKEPLSCPSRLADRNIIRLMSVVQTGVIFPRNFLQYDTSPFTEIQLMIYKRNTTLMPIKSSWQHHFRPGNAPYHLLCHTHFLITIYWKNIFCRAVTWWYFRWYVLLM